MLIGKIPSFPWSEHPKSFTWRPAYQFCHFPVFHSVETSFTAVVTMLCNDYMGASLWNSANYFGALQVILHCQKELIMLLFEWNLL